MDASSSSRKSSITFKNPGRFLNELDASATGQIVAAAADVALIIDKGIIKDIALGNQDLIKEGYEHAWRGRPWIETVTEDSRQKITDLLRDFAEAEPRWRQVNHPTSTGVDMPVKYTTLAIGKKDRIVAIGRDMRSESALQRRLVEAHQGLERDYARVRAAEVRYRILFNGVSEAVLIVNVASQLIEEANPAAVELLGAGYIVGAPLFEPFDKRNRRDIEAAIASAATGGQAIVADAVTVSGTKAVIAMTAFRDERANRIIARIGAPEFMRGSVRAIEDRMNMLRAIERLPDGLLVSTPNLEIIAANAAFLEMVNVSGDGPGARGKASDFIGRSASDFNVLMANLKRHGYVRNYSTVIRDRVGGEEDVEVSAVLAPMEDRVLYGFSIRNVSRRLKSSAKIGEELPSSAEQLTDLVGRVPLKEIVRESTDLIERLCIEAALEITNDNRASAAEMLGLSRQGLYSKLKRFDMDH